jgi:hypothetical protein
MEEQDVRRKIEDADNEKWIAKFDEAVRQLMNRSFRRPVRTICSMAWNGSPRHVGSFPARCYRTPTNQIDSPLKLSGWPID